MSVVSATMVIVFSTTIGWGMTPRNINVPYYPTMTECTAALDNIGTSAEKVRVIRKGNKLRLSNVAESETTFECVSNTPNMEGNN